MSPEKSKELKELRSVIFSLGVDCELRCGDDGVFTITMNGGELHTAATRTDATAIIWDYYKAQP